MTTAEATKVLRHYLELAAVRDCGDEHDRAVEACMVLASAADTTNLCRSCIDADACAVYQRGFTASRCPVRR